MADLALMVALTFLAMLITGPLSIWLAIKHYDFISLFVAALALMFGINWFINVQTPVRFLGMFAAFMGIFAIWYSVRLTRWD